MLARNVVTDEGISQAALERGWLFRVVPSGGQGAAHVFDSCTVLSLAVAAPCGKEQFPVEAIALSPASNNPSRWGMNA